MRNIEIGNKTRISKGQEFNYNDFLSENNNSTCTENIENVVNSRSDKAKLMKIKFTEIIDVGLYFEPQTDVCESFNSRMRQADVKMEIKNLIAKDNKDALELERLTALKDFLKTYKRKEVNGNGLAKYFLEKSFAISYVNGQLFISSKNERIELPFIGDCSDDFNFDFEGLGTLHDAIQKNKNKNFVTFQISENTLFLIDMRGNKLAGALGIPVLKRNFLKKKYYGAREILEKDMPMRDMLGRLAFFFGTLPPLNIEREENQNEKRNSKFEKEIKKLKLEIKSLKKQFGVNMKKRKLTQRKDCKKYIAARDAVEKTKKTK